MLLCGDEVGLYHAVDMYAFDGNLHVSKCLSWEPFRLTSPVKTEYPLSRFVVLRGSLGGPRTRNPETAQVSSGKREIGLHLRTKTATNR